MHVTYITAKTVGTLKSNKINVEFKYTLQSVLCGSVKSIQYERFCTFELLNE